MDSLGVVYAEGCRYLWVGFLCPTSPPPPPLSVVDGRDRVLVCQPVKQPGEGRIHQVSHIQVKKYKSLVLKEVKEYKVYQSTNTPGKFLKSSQEYYMVA